MTQWRKLRLGRRTCDQVLVGRRGFDSRRAAFKLPRSTQSSIPPGRSIEYRPGWLGLWRGAFTRVGWQVTLCDPISAL